MNADPSGGEVWESRTAARRGAVEVESAKLLTTLEPRSKPSSGVVAIFDEGPATEYTSRAMQSVKARVRNGRLVLDEPTDRPEGEEVELVPLDEVLGRGGDYLDDEERAALHRSIEDGIEDFERGDTEDAFEFIERLKARREDRDRQASASPGRTSK